MQNDDIPEATPEELEPPWDDIDEGILPLVRLLHENGFVMFSSCEGGEGHHFSDPTVIVWPKGIGGAESQQVIVRLLIDEGYKAFSVGLWWDYHPPTSHPECVEIRLESLDSIPSEKPEVTVGSRWLHRNGIPYEVVMFTNEHTEYPDKYPVTVVYRGDNGKTWSRPLSDWHRSMKPEKP